MIRSILARRLLTGVLLLGASCGAALPAGLSTTLTDERDKVIGTPTNPLVASDGNNVAYTTPGAPFVVGATVAPGRALLTDCSAAGSLVLRLSGSASAVPFQVAVGTTVIPFAVVQVVSAGTAACTFQNFVQ